MRLRSIREGGDGRGGRCGRSVGVGSGGGRSRRRRPRSRRVKSVGVGRRSLGAEALESFPAPRVGFEDFGVGLNCSFVFSCFVGQASEFELERWIVVVQWWWLSGRSEEGRAEGASEGWNFQRFLWSQRGCGL